MNCLRKMTTVFCLAMCTLLFASIARADEWNQKTTLTVKEPFEIPGMVLAPGTSVFKLMDSVADRNIVQIFNKREDHVYATLLAIPSYRMDPTDKSEITFWERAENAPPAIRSWFYPGDQYGEEFVYHKPKALEIAKRVNQPVVAMPAATPPTASELKKAPLVAVKPNAEEVQVAQVTKPSTPVKNESQVAAVTPKHLPKTASELPLVAIIGLLSLGAALALRFINQFFRPSQLEAGSK